MSGSSGKPVINLELNITANNSSKKLAKLAPANSKFVEPLALAA